MSIEKTACELRAELDTLNAEYVKLDKEIADKRERLYQIGKKRGELEREFQRVDAAEMQAAVDAGSKGPSSG